MLNIDRREIAYNSSSLRQWADRALELAGTQVRVRLRENNLHILWEGRDCPDRQTAIARVIEALKATNLNELLAADELPLNRVFLYGRVLGEKRPEWTESLEIDALKLEIQGNAPLEAAKNPGRQDLEVVTSQNDRAVGIGKVGSLDDSEDFAQVAQTEDDSWRELARQGNPSAIARYIGENLSHLGVLVKVVAKTLPTKVKNKGREIAGGKDVSSTKRRLWVFCECAYSPDPSLLAAPVTQQLRDLHLDGFRDAVIISQVTGEESPDWILRVDLTPPEEMLHEWAQWGDELAIERLLNQSDRQGLEITAVVKESTLHISCTKANREKIRQLHANDYQLKSNLAPDKQTAVAAIAPVLRALAPQGIKAAIIYGHQNLEETPVWVEWLGLPANTQPQLGTSPTSLAAAGDEDALVFLLGQLLNPDLDWRLASGGTRIQVRRKEDLLHIMADAPVCPLQQQVGPPIAEFVSDLRIPGVAGVRVYGRRAGQKQASWRYGRDFVSRDSAIQEAAPDFAATDDYAVEELVTETEEPVLKSASPRIEELKPNRGESYGGTIQEVIDKVTRSCYATLTRSQIFTPAQKTQNFLALPGKTSYQGAKVALVWGALGIMLTLSGDLVVGSILKSKGNLSKDSSAISKASLWKDTENPNDDASENITDSPNELKPKSRSSRKRRRRGNENVFDTSGFTKSGDTEVRLGATGSEATLSTTSSDYPSFNNTQLDDKLRIYKELVEKDGPPDILILGSSRAMRGIDPSALKKALAAQGYGDLKIFNFGINGATAQIVDLVIRRILTAEQLPKMIIWADGARAFNSGRVDITYNKIAISDGYKELVAGTLPRENKLNSQSGNALEPFAGTSMEADAAGNILASKTRELETWLNKSLGSLSASYEQRDRVYEVLRESVPNFAFSSSKNKGRSPNESIDASMINWDGFLPISVRFNPSKYYETHTKVVGDFDTDYKEFYLGGSQAAALESLVQYTQSQQIPLIFVNLPLSQEYLDTARRRYEQEFEMYMLRLSLSRGFIFRNWSRLWPERFDYFSDPSHLNRFGAAAVSARLAQDPLLNWPKKSKESKE